LPPDHRVQRDGGADTGESDDHLEKAAHQHAGVAAGAEDPVLVVLDRTVEGECGDRDEGDQVEDARDERGLPCRAHRNSSHCLWPGSAGVTEIRGRPRSRTFWSKPCRAAWSATWPEMVVVPSLPCAMLR